MRLSLGSLAFHTGTILKNYICILISAFLLFSQLNERGQRFGDELGRRDVLSQQIFKNCAANAHGWHTAYMVMNDASADQFGRPAFNFYSKVKRFFTVDIIIRIFLVL